MATVAQRKPAPQEFRDGRVHDWYRMVMGFSDHLVAEMIERFSLDEGGLVLDPFCGAGTTLVECMKRGIPSVGIDANPASCFASTVKTKWDIQHTRLLSLLPELQRRLETAQDSDGRSDPTYLYLHGSGMLDRGWISPQPLRKAIAIKQSIAQLRISAPYKNVLLLALIAEVVLATSNVKFGPELYCGPAKQDADVFTGFAGRVRQIADDLRAVGTLPTTRARVIHGDARDRDVLSACAPLGRYSAVICSPPYPAEHDYTRNSRLELAFLEEVSDRESLQRIKRAMIRSNTKGIYKGDDDSSLVRGHPMIERIVAELEAKIKTKNHGFARLYPRVVQEYFGGMKRHLASLCDFLAPGAHCAYVVGDQSCYLRVHIPTAEILSSIAEDTGFLTVEIRNWRSRWSTTTSRQVVEKILILKRP